MDKDKYFICPILNGPCSTVTEAEEIEAELHTRIKELEAQLKAAEARVKELEQGFREVLVCARNISEGYYEDAALLGRIARSFLLQVEKSPLHSGHDQPSRSFDQ